MPGPRTMIGYDRDLTSDLPCVKTRSQCDLLSGKQIKVGRFTCGCCHVVDKYFLQAGVENESVVGMFVTC